MNVSLRHSTNFKFRLLGLIDLVIQCFQLISGRLKSPVITMCEYLSPDVDLIIFRSSALFSSDPPIAPIYASKEKFGFIFKFNFYK